MRNKNEGSATSNMMREQKYYVCRSHRQLKIYYRPAPPVYTCFPFVLRIECVCRDALSHLG